MKLSLELLESLVATSAEFDQTVITQSLLQQVRQDVEDLDVRVSVHHVDDQTFRPTLLLEGDDAGVARNLLAQQYGTLIAFNDVTAGVRRIGTLRDPIQVGFGIFLDAGIIDPPKDVLIPLRVLRDQLAGGKALSVRAMTYALGWVAGYPLEIEIVSANVKIGKIEARLSQAEVDAIQTWIRERYERVLFVGATRQHVKSVIKKTRHLIDILGIERHGLLAGQVVLKPGTHAPGIVRAIGAQLSEARLGAFRPGGWKTLIAEETGK
ncbi:MAG TPA: DUF2110 family protein [Candidatus Lokiarchaeia archaeon]|nr:DUF2110 family protein [Candidatus Lokiarchaeia archaeon]